MTINDLSSLEIEASRLGYLLRVQVRRPLNLWTLRLVVGMKIDSNKIKVLGEMKAWAYPSKNGLQLDTMQVRQGSPPYISHLI